MSVNGIKTSVKYYEYILFLNICLVIFNYCCFFCLGFVCLGLFLFCLFFVVVCMFGFVCVCVMVSLFNNKVVIVVIVKVGLVNEPVIIKNILNIVK